MRIAIYLPLISLFFSGVLQAADIPGAPPNPAGPEAPAYKIPSIEKIGGGVFKIGEIMINKPARTISFPAQVNMDKGMLEYLIVHRAGKTHESLLRTSISPYHLQVAFILLGYEGTDKRLEGQGAPDRPKGEPVRISVADVAGKESKPFLVEEWLVNRVGEEFRDIKPLDWVFCGSFVTPEGYFMSQETGSIAAIWHDPVAIIDNASPGGESNRIWFVKQGTVPPVGTAVTVTIKPAK